MPDLGRLLRPESVAVIGGGAWCAAVLAQLTKVGYPGPVWHVHPSRGNVATVEALPAAPDAAFVGVNRQATVEVIGELAARGAGGAVCFASGYSEARAEAEDGAGLQSRLVEAARGMPILGPNCYGFINALDGALLWPDQHGCVPVSRGVAILTQSSNIAINLTMQRRALPLGFVGTCGNMAQTSQAELGLALLDDDRITVLGLHVEGFGDVGEWETLAARARAKGVPLVALKVGASAEARRATVSHTASLAGSDAGAQALLDRLGIPRVHDLPTFLETLKLLHVTGPLPSNRIASISCSGGEASLTADLAQKRGLRFPPLSDSQHAALSRVLGPMVARANPLDYHTYIWRDADAMGRAWAAMTSPDAAITLSVVDYPHTDASDWTCATEAAIAAVRSTGRAFGVVSTLPELMPADVAETLLDAGVVPLHGLSEALNAIVAAGRPSPGAQLPLIPAGGDVLPGQPLDEAEAKALLSRHGVPVPRGAAIRGAPMAIPGTLNPPFAVKGLGLAHKTEAGAVRLNLDRAGAAEALRGIGTSDILVEEMIAGGIAELLVGVTRDAAHGFVLTLGAGGTLTEIMSDTRSLLLPASRADIAAALERLRIYPLLTGYRGNPSADIDAILDSIEAIQGCAIAHADILCELEINPLICTADRAVAADALLVLSSRSDPKEALP